MPVKDDLDYAHGVRQPGPIPGRAVWQNIQLVRRQALALEKLLKALFRGFEGEQATHCLMQLDAVVCHAEGLLARFDRNGPPVDQSDLNDAEATIRTAKKFADQFVGFDLAGFTKYSDGLRKKGGV